jgi:NADPH:quinone reductase-like Zn-dependent oxidoreductase
VAKLLGAGRVVGTGRDAGSLQALLELGADGVINLKQSDEDIAEAFAKEAEEGYNAILDFLWGHPTEILIKSLIPDELAFPERVVHLIQVGEKAGPTISLPAIALRTSGLQITGAGNIPPEAMPKGSAHALD